MVYGELRAWAALGSVAWFTPLFLLAQLAWGLLYVNTTYSTPLCLAFTLVFWILQLGVLLAHLAVVSPREPPPLQVCYFSSRHNWYQIPVFAYRV